MTPLASRVRQGVLWLDGGMGTSLMAAGLQPGEAPERWLAERPEEVKAVHAGYAAAGCAAVYTNTFGGNRLRLEKARLSGALESLNRGAVALARTASPNTYVLGSIGPTGELLEPVGDLDPEKAKEAFAEQAHALVSAGADGIVCETFGDPAEAALAVAGAKAAGAGFILATFAFEPHGRTMTGATPEKAAKAALDAGADAVGANCGGDPSTMVVAIRALKAVLKDTPIAAKPNAGIPKTEKGRLLWPANPDDFAAALLACRDAGATLLGGCCGTTPAHLRAAKERIS